MDPLNRQSINSLSNAIQSRKEKVQLSKLWRHLHDEFNIGIIIKNHLVLKPIDYKSIREIVFNETGYDPITPLPIGDRINQSRYSGNEKLSSENPGRHHLLLNSNTSSLKINNKQIPLLMGCSYRIDWRNLNLKKIKQVIVVENLAAFDNFQMAKIEKELRNALVLYRGHNISTKATLDLLDALADDAHVIAFSDYDPKGIEISKTTHRVTHFLMPADPSVAFQKAEGTRERFDKQWSAIKYITENPLPVTLTNYWDLLIKNKKCIAQELMFSSNLELKAVKFIES